MFFFFVKLLEFIKFRIVYDCEGEYFVNIVNYEKVGDEYIIRIWYKCFF